jgi:hypothetical protein
MKKMFKKVVILMGLLFVSIVDADGIIQDLDEYLEQHPNRIDKRW